MRDHAQGAQAAGAHVGDDRVPVAGVAPGQGQLAVQVQGAAGVLAVGPDGRDRRGHPGPTVVAEKVTFKFARKKKSPLPPPPLHR